MSLGLGAHPHVVSQLNSNTVLASARPQLPAEQRRMFVVLTTQPQTGSLPTLSTNALQTQAPSCLSQNVCAPASATSSRYPFAQKLPGQIIVPYVNNVPMHLQGLQAQRGGIQKLATTLPNLVTHSLHPTAPSITQNINTRGVHIVTNVSPASANQVKNAPAITVQPVFHLNQSYLSAPSVQNAPGTQMAATLTSSLVNIISASSAVTPNTHKAGNHLVPTVSPSRVNQPLAPAVVASTEGNSPLMSADVPVNCQSPTESDAWNIYKVSIQQFLTEVNSSVENDHVNGDFAGNLQINQEASSSATEVIHEHSSTAVIKSEESRDGDTDCPLQIRIENIMSLSTCQWDFQQCVQDNATDTIASTESSLTETRSNTTEHQFKTVESSNFSFLHVVKGYFLCSVCQMKWSADFDSFFKHIWEKHTHEADFACCPRRYSPYCARLEAIVKTIYDKSQEPMSDEIRSYFTPKSCIETENEDVQNTSLSESSSSAPVSSRVETVTQINVSECPSSTVPVRPSSAARECEQILPAECVSRSSESSSSLPTTLILDQHRRLIEIEQNYDFGPLPAVHDLEKGAQDMQESAIQIEEQPAENQKTSSSCELRDDQSFSHENVRIITAIDMSSAADSNSGNQKSYYKNIYEDISDDDCDDINCHNRETGSVNYSLVDSLYSDKVPLSLSKKTAQPEKLHNSVTATPLLAAEMAAGSSVTHIERVPPERIDNPHDSFTITPLSDGETAVTSSVIECKHCASFFLNKSSWQKHMEVEHVKMPRMYCIKRKLFCDELKMHRHSNVPQQASQEDIPCLPNAERDAETTVKDYQCEGTNHKSHAMSEATANVLDEIETDASNVIENAKVCSKDVELPETHSHHEGRNVADGITAQTTHERNSAIPKLLDIVKKPKPMKRLISAVSLNTGKASDEQGAVANTEPNCIQRRNSVAQELCESGRCTTTINERRRSVDVDLHGLMRPDSGHGHNELREIVSEMTVITASIGGNDGLMQIENSGNKEEYVQPVLNTSTSIDSRNSVKSALSRDEDILRNTELDYEDQCCQEVVVEIPLGVQSSSHDNFGRTVSENISTSSYNITVPLNDHCLNEKSESCVGQAEAIGEISKSRVKHDASSSAVGNTDASSDLDQATSVESQDGCDVTSDSSSDKVSFKLPQTSDSSVGSKDCFNVTSTALSLPVTRVSDFASISAVNINLEMAETRTILCISEQNKLEYTENTCLPVQDIGADIDNRQESRHSSVVLKNNLRSGVQHDIEHGISNVVKDGEDQAASVAVNRQKPTESLVFQQTVKGASVINHTFKSAYDSETSINDLLKEPCINNRSHCTPDVSSVLKTVSHGSDDIPNPATKSLGPDHDTCHDIDFSSRNGPAYTLQESVDDFVGNVETLENDISCEHDILHHKTSSNLMQVIQAEKQEIKKGGSCDEIHYNKNSLVSTKGGQLYASNETSACIENAESRAKKDRDIFDSRSKRKPEAEPEEGIITSKRLRTNSERHNTPEDTDKQLRRSVAVSRSPKDIHEADVTAQVCRVNPESSHKMAKKRKIEMYKCVHCNLTCIWDLEKMNEHISSKHPYYSCEYCKASYDALKLLYGHFEFVHRGMEPSVVDGTIALDRLFKRIDISYKGQSAECKDITPQTSAKRKKRSPSSLRDGATKRKPNANSNINVIETKRHTHLKRISPVSEHEVSSAEKPTVTSKTAAISNNSDSLSAKTERNLFKTTMSIKIPQFDHAAFLDNQASGSKVTSTVTEESNRKAEKYTSNNTISSKFAKTIDHTHRMPPTVSLHTTNSVANQPNATALLSPQSAETNTRGNTVTEYQESNRHSSAQNVSSKIRSLGAMSSQNTVRKDNSSAATSNQSDINVSLNSSTCVQSSSTIKNQELNSVDISDKQASSNRHGNAHETFPEMICSETASCVSDTVSLHHTKTAASAIVTQDKKHCGTWMASQLETKTAAEGDENKNFVPGNLRTHSEKNLSMPNGSKTEFVCENAATTHKKPHKSKLLCKHDYPFRCTVCSMILKCVRDIERHYNSDHAGKDVQLTERKSGFVYSNSGKCLRWKNDKTGPTDAYMCSYCAFRNMKRFDVEEHIRSVHPEREVRVFSLCKPKQDRYRSRTELTSKVAAALPHEASRSNSPSPSSYFCNVCNDVKSSEFQYRLHLASHPGYKHTTQLTAGASFICHRCGYIAKSSSDFAQHAGEHIFERRFKCFMCEHDSHNKKSVRAHIKSAHNKTVDDDVGIIDRDKQRNVDLRPRLVNIDPKVVLIDPFRQQQNYLQQLVLKHGIKTLDLPGDICAGILTCERDKYGKYFDINKCM